MEVVWEANTPAYASHQRAVKAYPNVKDTRRDVSTGLQAPQDAGLMGELWRVICLTLLTESLITQMVIQNPETSKRCPYSFFFTLRLGFQLGRLVFEVLIRVFYIKDH
jgi:hypothetical protein